MKKYYRFFGGCLDKQENWLNHMAHQGYRLVKSGKLVYEFAECESDNYQYVIEFVAQNSYQHAKEYKVFLEDLGYHVFYKNANLNFSLGKVKWRPYGRGWGLISTAPGTYNKELLIVEKKNDGKAWELYTSNADHTVSKKDFYFVC